MKIGILTDMQSGFSSWSGKGSVIAAQMAVAVAAAEHSVLAHCNGDHADALDLIAAAHGANGSGWRMVACDVDGCDLACDEMVVRVPWPAAVADAAGIRSELVQLTKAARS